MIGRAGGVAGEMPDCVLHDGDDGRWIQIRKPSGNGR